MTNITTTVHTKASTSKELLIRAIEAYSENYNHEQAGDLITDSLEHALTHRHANTLLKSLVFCDIADLFPKDKGFKLTCMIDCLVHDCKHESDKYHAACLVLDKLNGNDLDSSYTLSHLMSEDISGNTKYMKSMSLARKLGPLYPNVALEDLRVVARFLVA